MCEVKLEFYESSNHYAWNSPDFSRLTRKTARPWASAQGEDDPSVEERQDINKPQQWLMLTSLSTHLAGRFADVLQVEPGDAIPEEWKWWEKVFRSSVIRINSES